MFKYLQERVNWVWNKIKYSWGKVKYWWTKIRAVFKRTPKLTEEDVKRIIMGYAQENLGSDIEVYLSDNNFPNTSEVETMIANELSTCRLEDLSLQVEREIQNISETVVDNYDFSDIVEDVLNNSNVFEKAVEEEVEKQVEKEIEKQLNDMDWNDTLSDIIYDAVKKYFKELANR